MTGRLVASLSSLRLFLPGNEELLADLSVAQGRQKHRPLSWPGAQRQTGRYLAEGDLGQAHSLLAKSSVSGVWGVELARRHSDDTAGFSSSGMPIFLP